MMENKQEKFKIYTTESTKQLIKWLNSLRKGAEIINFSITTSTVHSTIFNQDFIKYTVLVQYKDLN